MVRREQFPLSSPPPSSPPLLAPLTCYPSSQGGSKVRESIQPRDKPVEVPPSVMAGARVARKASGGCGHCVPGT